MYGSEETDPLVKYYDETLAVTSSQEADWYLERTRRFGGPVLDLACGTGRLSLLLLREGFHVTAVDQSAGMLALFRPKLASESEEHRRRLRILNQSMARFDTGQRFNTILCCDAFFHNLTVEDEIACLEAVARHLNPQGRFLFNLPHPTCRFILHTARTEDKGFGRKQEYRRVGAPGHITVERRERGDPLAQTIETILRFTVYDAQGRQVEQSHSAWTTRYLFRWEAVHLLYRCGFEVEELVGGYAGQPVGEGSQLVFQARLLSYAGWHVSDSGKKEGSDGRWRNEV
jgi:SAM-dependent methyltransferase